MEAVETYLRVVAALLPRAQREDIIAELRDIILSRIEAREAELGRPLTLEETEAVLRETGHPVMVAARYREGPQHVVGPALYPYWLFGVRIAVAIQVAAALVVFVIRTIILGDPALALGHAIATGVGGSVMLIGLATIAAWVVERQGVRINYLDRWRVRDIRGLEYVSWDWDDLRDRLGAARTRPRRARASAAAGQSRSPISRAISQIAGGAVLALWWSGVLPLAVVGRPSDLNALGIDLGALAGVDWHALGEALFWPILAYFMIIVLKGVTTLAWPTQTVTRGVLDLVIGASLIAFIVWLGTASPLAGAVRTDSLTGFMLQMKTDFAHAPPFPLAGFITVALLVGAFGAVVRVVKGLIDVLRGAERLAAAD